MWPGTGLQPSVPAGLHGVARLAAFHPPANIFGADVAGFRRPPAAMVTVITDKLHNQHLEDVESAPVPIPQSAGTRWTFNTEGQKTTADLNEDAFPGWPMTGGERQSLAGTITFSPPEPLASPPPAPPSKRACRSHSVPGDNEDDEASWKPQPSSVWRPVPVRHSQHAGRRRSPLSGRVRHLSSPSGPPLRPLPKFSHIEQQATLCPRPLAPRPASVASMPHDTDQQEAFRNRSVSMERDGAKQRRISAPSLRGGQRPGSASSTHAHHLHIPGGGSMPSIVIPGNASSGSPRLSRARSQPCVNSDRKCLKRRRDERPTLDLYKMQETSYIQTRQSRFRRYSSDQDLPYSRLLAPEYVVGLNTIASSPLDSNLPGSMAVSQGMAALGHDLSSKSTPTSPTCSASQGFMEVPGRGLTDSQESADHMTTASGEREDVPLFDLEINSDLDLDEIEND